MEQRSFSLSKIGELGKSEPYFLAEPRSGDVSLAASRTSRSSENNRFPYVFHWLVVSCKFRSICFAKFVR
jgi:hypothetical protein